MRYIRIIVCLCSAVFLASRAESRRPEAYADSAAHPTASAPLGQVWPASYWLFTTDSVETAFNSYGTLFDFSTPSGSGISYLWQADLWIGGVKGDDTLVASAIEGDFLPPGYTDYNRVGSIVPIEGPADDCYWALFTDTLHDGYARRWDGPTRPFKPLNVCVAQRSYAWHTGVAANCVFYDFVITNIGTDTIRTCYGGVYMDPDILSADDMYRNGTIDDIVGALPAYNICYGVDNDGDAWDGAYIPATSPTKAIAMKVLSTWPIPCDTGFNWISELGYLQPIFAPRRRTDTRTMVLDATGELKYDTDRYALMRTSGWDYNQVYTSVISPGDSVWQYPDSAARERLCSGGDSRFVYSFGPYTLLPDSSFRFIMTIFTGGRVHFDPYIVDYIHYMPELYEANLDLSGLISSARVADSLAHELWRPERQPTGLRVISITSDAAIIEWDPWSTGSTDGYSLYISEIPEDAYRDSGIPPIWYKAAELPRPVELGAQYRDTITGLNPFKAYSCRVANRFGDHVGAASEPVVIKLPVPAALPVPLRQQATFDWGQSARLAWSVGDESTIQHFNIYKFADSAHAAAKFSSFYSPYEVDQPATDSFSISGHQYYLHAMPIYAAVSASDTEFADSSPCDGCIYAITAVDTAGFETPFSTQVTAVRMPKRTQDILVITKSIYFGSNGVYPDSVTAFYDRVLAGYRHDYYLLEDTLGACAEIVPACMDWRDFARYRLVIVDDGLRDIILRDWYEDIEHGFAKYLRSGGVLVYCGSFANFGSPAFTIGLTPRWFSRPAPFIKTFFGVDSVFYVGSSYYKNTTVAPYVDSVLGFARAEAISEAPSISFDSIRNPFVPYITSAWPASSPPSVSAFVVDSSAAVTHLFRSLMPATSRVEGRPVGVHKQTAEGNAYLFGFHLWYMQERDAKALVDWIMERVPTDVVDTLPVSLPSSIQLMQNYPNPFNAGTELSFELPQMERVTLDIFNILGQRVMRLLDGEQSSGVHRVAWDGTEESGRMAASGIYLYRLQTGSGAVTRKMVLLR